MGTRSRRPRDRRPRRRLALTVWSIGTITTWAFAWLIYTEVFELGGPCVPGTPHGGRAHSEGWAGFIGLLLLMPVAILAVRWRRRLVLLFAAFVTAYASGLLALWTVSPAIWGPVRWTCGSL
jgi:hypothetical protein